MKQVYLSLGSNLGDRAENIRRALAALSEEGIEVRRISALYRTEPVDFLAQPWFVNCVAEVATDLLPLRLLKVLKGMERRLGRRPSRVAKGPRAIDIDILLYENAVVRSRALVIPHERLVKRRFVLVPLAELAPGLRHPVTQRTIKQLLQDTGDKSQVMRMDESVKL